MRRWSEVVPPGEPEAHEALAARVRALQSARAAAKGRAPARALHLAAVAAARAELSVLPGLPAPLRVGIFAEPADWAAVVRFSNGAGHRAPDSDPDVRGMAVKVLDVPGEKLIPALRDARTQDFLAIASEVTPFATAEEFVTVLEAAAGSLVVAPLKLAGALGPRRAWSLLAAIRREFGAKLAHYVDRPFYSALPIQWGEEAVKFGFFPVSVPDGPGPDRSQRQHYGPDLAARLARGPIAFELRVQRFVDDAATPIEDASVRWRAAWEPVARLTLPAQDLASDEGRAQAERIDALSFDPWHAPVAFRPLGAVMRARSAAYRESVLARSAAPEPTGRSV